MKKKILLIIPIILFILGVSYAFYEYYRVGESNNEIVAGQIYMKYTDSNTLYLTNIFPETKEEALKEGRTDNEIRFSIKGKNEYTKKDIYYEINLNLGDEITGKKRIRPEDVMIYLECDGEVLVNGMTYSEWDETRIWVHTIPANTLEETTKNYVLKAWVREDLLISDSNPNANYTADDWNLSYISLKLSVYGDFVEKDLPVIGYITYDMSSLGMTNPTSSPIYGDNTGTVTSEVTSTTLTGFLGWSITLDGEVVYLPGDQINADDIVNNNLMLYPVMKKEYLVDKITSTMSLTEADSSGTKYVYGQVSNNYLWYSGKLWRIVSINSDGSVKLVTNGNMSAVAWNIVGSDTNYGTSQVHNWLKNEFLPTLYDSDKLLKSVTWDYTAYTSATSTMVTPTNTVTGEKVGLLTMYEYYKIRNNNSSNYLNTAYNWWTMTPYNTSNVWRINFFGSVNNESFTSSNGIRPSVNLVANIEIVGGTGVESDPYMIKGDKTLGKVNELVNRRVVGEYIRFDNTLYRIVGIENDLTKVTMADYSVNGNAINQEIQFGNDGIFSETVGIGLFLKEWYDDDINETYKKMIATPDNGVVWYQGTDTGTNDYTLSKTGTPISATIGLPYYGEMFSSQFKNANNNNSSSSFWLMTRPSSDSTNVFYVINTAHSGPKEPSSAHGVRPSFYLKADVKIGDTDGDGFVGNGTPDNPYEITQ